MDIWSELKDLFHYYYPIEIDPNRTLEEKRPLMVEWWTKAHELLVQQKIHKDDIAQIVRESEAMLRFHPQHKNVVLELAAKADLAPVTLRLAWGAGLCQVAAKLRKEMAFHEPRLHLCMELCPGRLGLSQVVLIILPTSPTCCTSPMWFLAVPTVAVRRQAVPCAPAEQLMCSGDVRQKAGVLHVPTSTCPAAAPKTLGFCTGKAMGVLVPQRAHAVGRAHMDGFKEFFDQLHKNNIPLFIFSAGVGDILEEIIHQANVFYSNVNVVSNYMAFNDDGVLTHFKGPLIHTYNKNNSVLQGTGYFQQLSTRTSIILLGDSMGDLTMADGVPSVENILKIGFLNDKVEERRGKYLDSYDIVLESDETLDVVNGILRYILTET
ncbi:hypothetical protein IHE44_0010277 [Lamprotornis superbus]|uniref:5'-nucleotidase n=1 Tax=Lamprotornis superbus TaxID=245042 RepID=A0A835NJG9_9PASS|nr:hypothetical protein IHE44_0010277 [Lamprotornis superbus]